MSKPLYCGFCGKAAEDVTILVAGPAVHICNECVDLCHAIVHKTGVSRAIPSNLDVASMTARLELAQRVLIDTLDQLQRMRKRGPDVIGFGDRDP